ncbi:hypothetical protein ACFUTY_19600 [Streptomyces sp. NPDC057362]|uniref:hypothetical protein n=1 Tax=Streptomyces sp. NPDC057362 TaxID=3346106 RepID=UPI003633E0E8
MPETFPPAVGQLYDPTRPGLPEGMSWSLSTRGVELLLSLGDPTPVEIDAVGGRTGPARFAFIEQPNVLLMCFRLGEGIRWSAQPWQAVRQEEGSPPGLPGADQPEAHLRIHIYLADAATGIVRAHGTVSWPPWFTAAVRAAIERHLAGPQDDDLAAEEIRDLYRRWPSTADMVRERADATCRGGAQ